MAQCINENITTDKDNTNLRKDETAAVNQPQPYRHKAQFESKKGKVSPSSIKAIELFEKMSRRQSQADESQRLSPDPEEEDELFLSTSKTGRKPLCYLPNTSGVQISEDVASVVDEERDTMLVKTYYSAFNSTNLLASLRSNLVTKLFISGLASNTTVYATAL